MRHVVAVLALALAGRAPAQTADKVLFDFEDDADVKAWSALVLPDAKEKEPPPRWRRSAEHATRGRHSLEITFAGGRWPTLTTTRVPDDWQAWQTFRADVTVSRPCLVGFTVLQERSSRDPGWDGAVSRWTKTEFLTPGTHTVAAALHPNEWSAIRPKLQNGRELGKVVRFEVFVYSPADGETIYLDNIRLCTDKLPPPPPGPQFKLLGTDREVGALKELRDQLPADWAPLEARTVEQAEADFRRQYEALKKTHPKAVLAVFRDGEGGYDPAHPERVFAGWRDAYWSSQGPDSMTVERAANYGRHATQEVFMRHRSPLFRCDLSSIPQGSEILSARFLLVRAGQPGKEQGPGQRHVWVAEACNRPWEETEVNAYEYARGKFWRAYGGMSWAGDDPDFWPLYLAHGQGRPGCNDFDFTQAVRWWTDGRHANHGFMLHGDSKDWFKARFREAEKVKDRPALLVVYEPR
jgi:hypothetical protein